MDDLQTEKLEKRMREKIVIGTQISDKFQKYVESGDFNRNVDFRTSMMRPQEMDVAQLELELD